MENKKQVSIERTLLIGLCIGLLIGFISKRVASGLLLGTGLTFIITYFMKPKEEDKN
ncbi:MAG: hypothetical protein K2X48_12145 [Chitinophagaceae bacterium]|nr:hypothetical protein [Chitinophagaceae bacterium]